jgi:hypothetical protein
LNNNENKVDRGQLLETAVKQSGMSVEAIMKKLGYSSRNTYYRHISTPDLSLDILQRYGKAIHYDFSIDLNPQSLTGTGENPPVYLPVPETIEEAISQRDFYWRKYNEQLEQYRKLLLRFEEMVGQVPVKQRKG